MRNEIKKVGSMREYTEQDKEKKIKSEKNGERFEKEFQPEKKPKKNDEMGNDFIPIVDKPNNTNKLDNEFEPVDDSELNPICSSRKTPREIKNGKIEKNNLILKESTDLAEMTGIILGDGCIPKDKCRIRVTLNRTEEKQYRKFVYDLMQKLFRKNPTIYKPKDANAVKMSINSKEIVRALINTGLKSGNKKDNQVDVPQWIKREAENRRSSLRGLVDTDGSIHIHKHNKKIRISFKNASHPLVNDYMDMCETFNIQTQKIYHDKKKDLFEAQIETKKDVVNFIKTVQPRKWEYRAKTLGLVLKSINNPEKREMIDKELIKSYPDKKVHYSDKYYDLLKQLCIKFRYDVSDEALFSELEKALTYSENWTRLKKDQRELLNEKAKNLISDLKIKLNNNKKKDSH